MVHAHDVFAAIIRGKMSFPAAGENHPVRKFPVTKVGDKFGPYTVTALLPRGYKGRSDERVEWRCECGRWGEAFVFNIRKIHRCHHCKVRTRNQDLFRRAK